jgi:formylglycine-generating enzyme required for sulfatase activity
MPLKDDLRLRVTRSDAGEVVALHGPLAGGEIPEARAFTAPYVATDAQLQEVGQARRRALLDATCAQQIWSTLQGPNHAGQPTAGSRPDCVATALRDTLTPTLAATARRRVVLDAAPSSLFASLPVEGMEVMDHSPFVTGRAELLRLVHVDAAPVPVHAPYLRTYRALVLVGDVEQAAWSTGSTLELLREVQAVVDAMREVSAEVLVLSATGRLAIENAVQRPLLLDGRGVDEAREARFRSELRRLLASFPIDVLHYIGHGDEGVNQDLPAAGPSSTRIAFSLPLRPGDSGRPQRVWVGGDELASWIRHPVRLCTVTACAAAPHLAHALCLAAEHVVIMTARISPEFGAAWSRALYPRLFEERLPLGVAVREARLAMAKTDAHCGQAWIPQHYARTLDDSAFQDLPFRPILEKQLGGLGVMLGVQAAWWQPKDHAWIDEVYVELGIDVPSRRTSPNDETEVRRAQWTLGRLVEIGAPNVGRSFAHYRLIGAAGTGKTTALRTLARRLTWDGARLPFYIRLTEWERAGFGPEFLRERGLVEPLIQMNAPQIVWLLDGLDEVRDLQGFRELLQKQWFPTAEATLVVAGRSSAGSIGDRFLPVEVLPLSRAQAVDLAARVLNVERGQADAQADSSDLARKARGEKKLERIGDHADSAGKIVTRMSQFLRREVEVPLFVTLAAHLWANGKGVTTDGRMAFYTQVLDLLMEGGHRVDEVPEGHPLLALRAAARAMAVESIAREDGLDAFRSGRLEAALQESTFAKHFVPLEDVQEIATFACIVVRRHLLAAGLFVGHAQGEIEWAHPSFREALVAEALLEAPSPKADEPFALADKLIAARTDAASAYAEAFALYALGLRPDDGHRRRWVEHLIEVEREGKLSGRLASRLLFLGVPVDPDLVAEILGVTDDWGQRYRLYAELDESDAEAILAYFGAVVPNAWDVDEDGTRRLRVRDLGVAWEQCERTARRRDAIESVQMLRRAIMDLLPTPTAEVLKRAFATIGGAWINEDAAGAARARAELEADRSALAPLRKSHDIDAAPLDTPFWIPIDGNVNDRHPAFAIGADSDDEMGGRNETPPEAGVRLSSFSISTVPVTRGLYRLFDPDHPTNSTGRPDEPATQITWYEARLFCAWATHHLARMGEIDKTERIDLPTEYQWEYAARERGASKGGSRYHTGRDQDALNRAGWNRESDYGRLGHCVMPVGLLTPARPLGADGQPAGSLWDCHGNAWEWCRNLYGERLEGGSDPETLDPEGAVRGAVRVLRGGSFDVARGCRASFRGRIDPAFVVGFGVDFVVVLGFRLVRAPSSRASIFDP